MIEQNQLDTTKLARSTTGLMSSGTAVCCDVSLRITVGRTPRDRAKPLLEVGGRPILTRILERVRQLSGVSEVVVIANARFADGFRAWRDALEGEPSVRVLDDGSTCEANRLGAIGDLGFALERVPLNGEDWLVIAGDNLIEFDLRPLQRAFLAHREPLVVLTSDHGATRLVEHTRASGRPAHRVDTTEIVAVASRAASRAHRTGEAYWMTIRGALAACASLALWIFCNSVSAIFR